MFSFSASILIKGNLFYRDCDSHSEYSRGVQSDERAGQQRNL